MPPRTGASGVRLVPTSLSRDRTTASPALETPLQILTALTMYLTAKVSQILANPLTDDIIIWEIKALSVYLLQISYVVVSWEISWATSNLPTILATIRLMWTVSGPLTLRTRGASLLLYLKSSSLLRMSVGMFLSWGRVVWYTCRFGCLLIIAARIHVIELLPSL